MLRKVENIRKRNGQIVSFDQEKITNAIWAAVQAVGGRDFTKALKLSDQVVKGIRRKYEDGSVPSVEHVQDIVEKVLIENGHAKVAKAYILYREQHKNIREVTRLLRDITIIDDYLDEMDWRVRENSNMTYSLQGLNVHITQKVVCNYWLNSVYPKEIRDAHLSGEFHIHDLGTLGPYCVGWDLQDLLIEGFRGVRGKVESKAARHFDVALMQVVNFLYTLQGEAAGAQAFSNFDTLLAPFIYYDGLSYDMVKQCLQKFLYNMNVPTRVGFQTPFTNITLDLKAPEYLGSQPVVIGGEVKDKSYGEFQEQMDIFNRAFAETMSLGDATGRPFTFPIPTYNVTPDFPWESTELDPVWEMTAKYGIPYFSNFINSDLKPDDVRSMCCRLRLDKRELQKRGGGLFGSNPLTGSVGVVTLNLPRIGYEAGSDQEFLEILGSRMELAKESLIIKREVLEKFTDRGLYPYSRFYLRNIKTGFGNYWKNHFSTIGIIGMNDAAYNLLGVDLTRPEGVEFAVRALDFMRGKLADFQAETNSIFNLEATPAEGASYRLARIDKKLFPEIKIYSEDTYAVSRGNGKRLRAPYYTNSTQLPVGFSDDVFDALKLQDPLQSRYTGGTVLHAFLGERMPSIKATKALVKTIAENFHLPYYSLTPTFSICEQHGYLRGEQNVCPTCGETCEVWSRSVGYLRPVDQWNPGKQVEFDDRRTYDRQLRTQTMVPRSTDGNVAEHEPVESADGQIQTLEPMPAHTAAVL
ncbi:MAG: ribonucleoside triphosphate reductase [Spirochaetaceae bacterium]|nr:MAG: ribonucleoside triphosphate reductase [Spirochaetaceae bacterium]